MTSILIDGPAGPVEAHVRGDGHPVVLLPSLGRGATDFDDLAGRLAAAGYRAICPEPRGIGGNTSPIDSMTMDDLAADVAATIEALADGPVTLVGHAFGNRVARLVATRRPELVESVVLLACGGLVPAGPEATAALLAVFDVELDDEDHLDAVRTAFFAPGNDPSVWFDGWHGIVAAVQSKANIEMDVDEWWMAGEADVLVVQPEQDVMAVPENAARIAEQYGDRATVLSLSNAGHAVLPEQPEEVAKLVLNWLDLRLP